VSARTFRGATLIDNGGTLTMEFEDAEGGTAFVLVPTDQALDLGTQIMVEAADRRKSLR
jgi:hypothetical protein